MRFREKSNLRTSQKNRNKQIIIKKHYRFLYVSRENISFLCQKMKRKHIYIHTIIIQFDLGMQALSRDLHPIFMGIAAKLV
jgi:thioredoxin-related protein